VAPVRKCGSAVASSLTGFRSVCSTGLAEPRNGRGSAAMADRKANGGGASASSSGTNLLFSSSATEFSFNVPFIPVTQAAASPASLLLPGGSEPRALGGQCLSREAGGTGVSPALSRLPGSAVTSFQRARDWRILEEGLR
jgi:hypothetical protein